MKDLTDLDVLTFTPQIPMPQAQGSARRRTRHYGVFFSFLLLVVAPVALAAWYLQTRAADQYISRAGFSVRAQEPVAQMGLFEGLGAIGNSAATDTDILNAFIRSQEMVELIDARLDLRSRFSLPQNDPVFAFDAAAPVEDLARFWQSMVAVQYDAGTGLIELEVRAFRPDDAADIAQEILDQSSVMINRLSAIARDDATGYARAERDAAIARLKNARQALTEFRATTQMIDPQADIQGHMTVLIALQQTLAETYIQHDLLAETSRADDPRLVNLARELSVIEARIDAERRKFGLGSEQEGAFSQTLAEFEELRVDLEFAQSAYLSALAAYDAALRDAQQQSRYLAAYVNPTLPERPEYPQKAMMLGLVALFCGLIWGMLCLVYYSLRDRA